MQALAAGQGKAANQRLADQLVGEAEACLGGVITGDRKVISSDDQIRALGLVDSIQQRVSV